MSLLCPLWTPFWSHFGSQVPNYTPLRGGQLRLLCFFGVCFQRRFFCDFRLDSCPPPQQQTGGWVKIRSKLDLFSSQEQNKSDFTGSAGPGGCPKVIYKATKKQVKNKNRTSAPGVPKSCHQVSQIGNLAPKMTPKWSPKWT